MINIAIIVAGGVGNRFVKSITNINGIKLRKELEIVDAKNKNEIIKQNVILPQFNITSLEKCVMEFEANQNIHQIVISCGMETEIEYTKQLTKKPLFFVNGGVERVKSVANALWFVKQQFNSQVKCVLVHDAARPFVSQQIINDVIDKVNNTYLCAVPAIAMTDTIKQIEDGKITTLDRRNIFRAQTPQAFNFKTLFECYKNLAIFDDKNTDGITDDCSVVERFFPDKIKITNGDEKNKKITLIDDLLC